MRQGIADGFVLPAEIMPGHRERDCRRPVREGRGLAVLDAVRASFPRACRRRTARGWPPRARAAIERTGHPGLCASSRRSSTRSTGPRARKSIGGDRPAGRPGVLRRPRALLHDAARRHGRSRSTQTGLAEVARIRAEMEAIVREVGFAGQLRRVPRVPAQRPAVLREDARAAAAGTPPGSRARSTAACRTSSAAFRARRTR